MCDSVFACFFLLLLTSDIYGKRVNVI